MSSEAENKQEIEDGVEDLNLAPQLDAVSQLSHFIDLFYRMVNQLVKLN